jgi:uncharacterized protein YigA (DUF484 family)
MAVEAVTVSVDQPYSESWDIRSVAGLGDPESGYPLVQLIDHEGYEVSQVQARVDSTGYVYKADLYIPPVDLLDTVALMRLGELGVLAFASSDPSHFTPHNDTLLLGQLGRLLQLRLPELARG